MKHRRLLRGLQLTIDNLAGALLADSYPCCAMHDTDIKSLCHQSAARFVQQTYAPTQIHFLKDTLVCRAW